MSIRKKNETVFCGLHHVFIKIFLFSFWSVNRAIFREVQAFELQDDARKQKCEKTVICTRKSQIKISNILNCLKLKLDLITKLDRPNVT